jgi:two-component system, chemotaxis family, sensor kinase CheA
MTSDLEVMRYLVALKEAIAARDLQAISNQAGELAALARIQGTPVARLAAALADPVFREAVGPSAVAAALELGERIAFDPADAEAVAGLEEWLDPTDALNEAAMLLVEGEDRSSVLEAARQISGRVDAAGPLGKAVAAVLGAEEAPAGEWNTLSAALAQALEGALEGTEATAPLLRPTEDMTPEAVAPEGPEAVPFSLLPTDVDRTLLEEFLEEAADHLGGAEESLLALEADPDDKEAVNVVFRAFHTIKGVAGFLDLGPVVEVAHHAETLLARVRDGEVRFEAHVTDLTLQAADLLKALFAGIRMALEGRGVDSLPPRWDDVMGALKDPLRHGVGAGPGGATGASGVQAPSPSSGDGASSTSPSAGETSVSAPPPEGASAQPFMGEDRRTGGTDRRAAVESSDAGPKGGGVTPQDASVRVRTERLDRLVDLVGELVIAQSMVVQDPTVLDTGGELGTKVGRASKILRDLQDLSTSMRMVPLKPAFLKVSRVVRDVSRRSGKQVEFVQLGEDTEIDRSMVDILADPLIHMVRNSVDHGIESAAERRAAGKPESGTVQLKAFQASGRVVVEISDDGKGLDRERILAKARDRRLVDGDRNLSDAEVFALIFEPGFSTAEKVTDISGRGVGMDVVRRSVDSLRGRIEVTSEPGQGTTFSIQLPLTLAITDGMLVRVGTQRYILPTTRIQTCFRPAPEDITRVLGRGEMVRLHEDLFPLVRLHRINEVEGAEEDPTKALVVVAGEASRRVALLVDELVGQQQFVVKALTGLASRVPGVSGGSVLGDGTVGLILDPDELSALARNGTDGTRGGNGGAVVPAA